MLCDWRDQPDFIARGHAIRYNRSIPGSKSTEQLSLERLPADRSMTGVYRLLIVDDEYVIRDGLAEGINWQELGFDRPDTASNGQEALTLMEQRLPDLVITDVKMPIMDGIELCSHIRRQYPMVRTIILSGFGEFEFARQAIEQKVCAYLLKPLKEEQLTGLVSSIRQDLDSERQHRQTADTDADGKMDPDDLKQMVFLKLLSGNTQDIDHDLAALRQQGLDLNQSWFTIIAMAADALSSRPDHGQAERFFTAAQSFWQPYQASVLHLNRIWLIILCEQVRSGRNSLQHRIRQFQDLAEKTVLPPGSDYQLSFGVSSGSNTWQALGRCQNEAEQALQERFYSGSGQVVFYTELGPDNEARYDASAFNQYAEAIAGSLLEQSSSLIGIVRQMCDKLQSIKTRDINLLNVRCIQIYTVILNRIKEEYVYLPAPTVDELYERISTCRTFDALARDFQAVMLDLARQIASYTQNSDRQQFITRLKQYIRENYHARLSLDQLAQTFFINASYLSKIFKDETNEKLSDYIMNVRLANAKSLLRSTPARVQDIAAQVGYEDYRHFCTVFKKATGLTPLQYRIKSV